MVVKKSKFDDVLSRFDAVPACDRQTDILPQHSLIRYAYASCDKNRSSADLII